MKREITFFLFLVFVLSLASAATIEMDSEFDQGGLLLARVSGNFIEPPLKENILFYRDEHVRVGVIPTLLKLGEDYYISATLPQDLKNYSLVVTKVKYYNGTKIEDKDLRKNFVTTTNLADFSVEPGAVAAKESFFVKIQNLRNEKIIISAEILEIEDSISLRAGESKTLSFKTENIPHSILNYLVLESERTKYQIPVLVFEEAIDKKEESGKRFEFIPSSINATFATNSPGTRIIYLNNTGGQTLENLSFVVSKSLKDFVSLSVNNITELEKFSMVRIELSFLPQEKEGNFEGHISAREENFYTYLSISADFVNDYVPSETEIIDPLEGYSSTSTSEEDEDEESSLGKTIGWVIVILVVLVAAWFFFKKYRGAKGKSVDFSKR